MWIFNIFLQALAPIVDLTIIWSLFNGEFLAVLYYTAAFFLLDLLASSLAIRLDGEDVKQVLWLFWQRFFYREFLYYIIISALLAALRGGLVGLGKASSAKRRCHCRISRYQHTCDLVTIFFHGPPGTARASTNCQST